MQRDHQCSNKDNRTVAEMKEEIHYQGTREEIHYQETREEIRWRGAKEFKEKGKINKKFLTLQIKDWVKWKQKEVIREK